MYKAFVVMQWLDCECSPKRTSELRSDDVTRIATTFFCLRCCSQLDMASCGGHHGLFQQAAVEMRLIVARQWTLCLVLCLVLFADGVRRVHSDWSSHYFLLSSAWRCSSYGDSIVLCLGCEAPGPPSGTTPACSQDCEVTATEVS